MIKASVVKKDLAAALKSTAGLCAKSTLPILQCVVIEGTDAGLSVTGSNLEVEVCVRVHADMARNGKIAVHGGKLSDVVKRLDPDAVLRIEADKNGCKILCGRSRFRLPVEAAEDFPFIADVDAHDRLLIRESDLLGILNHCYAQVARNDPRWFLNGLLITAREDGITGVGTDGKRLATMRVDSAGSAADAEWDAIVPRGSVDVLRSILAGRDETIELVAGGSDGGGGVRHLRVDDGRATVVTRLIDGRFPEWKRSIKDVDYWVGVNRQELAECVARGSALSHRRFSSSDGKGSGFSVKLSFCAGSIRVSGLSGSTDESVDEIGADVEGIEDVDVVTEYLVDAINGIAPDDIEIGYGGAPEILLRPHGVHDRLQVVMAVV